MRTKAVLGAAIFIVSFSLLTTGSASAETYSYDAMGRVVQVVTDDGHTITYTYDAAGNRTSVTVK
jgi:YD repeat-containing protein